MRAEAVCAGMQSVRGPERQVRTRGWARRISTERPKPLNIGM